jgi:hypothetical protein
MLVSQRHNLFHPVYDMASTLVMDIETSSPIPMYVQESLYA